MLFILLNCDLIWFSCTKMKENLEHNRHTEQTVSGKCSINRAVSLCSSEWLSVWKSLSLWRLLKSSSGTAVRFSSAELFLNVSAFSSVGKAKADALSQHKIENNFI